MNILPILYIFLLAKKTLEKCLIMINDFLTKANGAVYLIDENLSSENIIILQVRWLMMKACFWGFYCLAFYIVFQLM